MFDDLIFYTTLAGSISLGTHYKKFDNYELRRNFGAGLGILIACLICGTRIFHTILMVWGNIFIIRYSDRRYIHKISLAWTWLYLVYIHLRIANPGYEIWLNQTIALRLVGLAFELHSDIGTSTDNPSPQPSSSVKMNSTGDTDRGVADPLVVDIVSYAFFFIGLHKGPYYKWKIYKENLAGSFGALGDCSVITQQKLKKILICLGGYFLLRIKYSPYIYYSDSFYIRYDMDTRYLYNIPLLMMFLLKTQIIMLLATSVCTEAGFGVYPAKCQPLPGLGPSARHSLLKLSANPEKALEHEYNFSMLKCFQYDSLLMGPRMKDTLKSWDMSSRYWFWAYIYKNLIKANKETRGIYSYLAWTVWKGPSLQQLLISSTLWVYIHLEAEYSSFYETNTSMKLPWDIGFSIMRMFCLIYLTPCFVVNDAAVVLRYYNSIFWMYHIIMLLLTICAFVIKKKK